MELSGQLSLRQSERQHRVQELVPSVGDAGDAPVAAVHAGVVSAVGGGVAVLPQLRQQRHVQQVNGLGDGAKYPLYHGVLRQRTRRVCRSADRLRLPAAAGSRISPVSPTASPPTGSTFYC